MFSQRIIALILLCAMGILFLAPSFSYAADGAESPSLPGDTSPSGRMDRVADKGGYKTDVADVGLSRYIGIVINAVMSLLGVIFVAQMVYAGYLWMTARDEAEQFDKAKDIIRRSIVGLAITLAAWAITYFVLSRLIYAMLAS